MTKNTVAFSRPAYSVAEFAKAVGLSETVIRDHISAGDLVTVWPTKTKQIVRLEDGLRWLEALPTDKPDAA